MPSKQLDVKLYVATLEIGEENCSNWVAYEGQTGLFGFGETESGSLDRLMEGVRLLMNFLEARGGTEAVVGYLNRHAVKWSELPATTPVASFTLIPSEEPALAHAG